MEVWAAVVKQLKEDAGLWAKTVFKWLHRDDTGKFQDGQLRTIQGSGRATGNRRTDRLCCSSFE